MDLIVIGAGPGGSVATAEALRSGLTVAQFEKCRFPRVKACAGGLTARSWNRLPASLKSLCRNESLGFEFNVWKVRSNRFSSSLPILRFVYRPELDRRLLELNSRFEKFHFFEDEPVLKISYDGLFHVRTRKRVLSGRQLIGADGAHSIVNRTFGLGKPRAHATALEVVLPMDDFSLAPGVCDVPSFDFSAISQGYGWVFPKDDHWSAGLYTLDSRPTGAKKGLLRYLLEKGFQPEEGLISSLKAHRYPVGGYDLEVPEFPVYLVGDAGGFAEAIMGEGIYFALESGRLAGEVVCSVHFGQGSHRSYFRKLRNSVLPDTLLSYKLAKLFYRNPSSWLRIFEVPLVWRPLLQGYSEGKTLTQSLLSTVPCFIRSVTGRRLQVNKRSVSDD